METWSVRWGKKCQVVQVTCTFCFLQQSRYIEKLSFDVKQNVVSIHFSIISRKTLKPPTAIFSNKLGA